MTPNGNYILFRPFQVSETSEGGIVLPESFKKPSNKGEIVAVGERAKLKAGIVGYRVKDWGDEVIIDGITHYVMTDRSIIATE